MWSPAPMARVFLVTLDSDLPQATAVLGRAGAMHLLPVPELGPWARDLGWPEVAELAARYDGYRRRVGAVLSALALGDPPPGPPVPVAPLQVDERAGRLLPPVEAEVAALAEQEQRLREQEAALALTSRQLQLLARLPVDLAELRRLTFVHLAAALVPRENLQRLRGSLAGEPAVLLPVAEQDGRVLLFAFTTKERKRALERALESAYAQRADIPPDLSGTPAQALRGLEGRLAELQRQFAGVEQARGALAGQRRDELWQLAREVALNGAAVDAWRRLARTERTRLAAGWVPVRALPTLQADLQEAVHGRLAVDVAPPPPPPPMPEASSAPREPPPGPQPPTALVNVPPARPFEALVTTYGIPSYYELDPTPLAGLLFVVMFGIMFGDVGQGAVIAAAGWLLTREIALKGNRVFGWILLASGISAIVFGALYGTVFLSEGLLPALWFRPLASPTYFIEVSVLFGIGVLSLALGLHMANAARAGDRLGLLLDRQGLVGLWFYWGAVYAALAVLSGRSLGTLALMALIGLPLLVMAFVTPLRGLFQGAPRPGSQAIVVSVVETFDTAVRYVSNTVSFVRLAAFAIAHVGIGIMVFTLAALVRVPGGSAVVVVLGNAFVIGLEGLVVFIQALRLDYYEFFTKFLRADGSRFRPFVLPGARRSD